MCLTLLIPGGKGDTPRQLLRQMGPEIHPISPNRVQEACEGWDGVPSLHNAKAVQVDSAPILGRGQPGVGRIQLPLTR